MDKGFSAGVRDREFIFIAGLHRSGTSLLHQIIRSHPDVSGFSGTGAPEDEGQLLQSVYEPAKTFGGPGRFAFDKRSYMDESHPLATAETADALFAQWSGYWDTSRRYLAEKSPPNIVRTRFLQKLFPNSKFIVILRHPLAVAYATKKWRKRMPVKSLIEHTLLAYETFQRDMSALRSAYVLKYEDLVADPQRSVDNIFRYLDLPSIKVDREVRNNVNQRYFEMWEKDRKNWLHRLINSIPPEFEARANRLGYSIVDCSSSIPAPWFGVASQPVRQQVRRRINAAHE